MGLPDARLLPIMQEPHENPLFVIVQRRVRETRAISSVPVARMACAVFLLQAICGDGGTLPPEYCLN